MNLRHLLGWATRPRVQCSRFCLLSVAFLCCWVSATAGTLRPYYQRRMPAPQRETDFASDTYHIDFSNAHLAPYGVQDPVAEANRLFEKRTAAALRAAVGIDIGVNIGDLMETKAYGTEAPTIHIPTRRCLAAMAYADYFPTSAWGAPLRDMVAKAIRSTSPGWAGTFGPGVDAATDLFGDFHEGNYDMTQMFLIPIAYRYYDELPYAAGEHLIIELLAHGVVHRPRVPDHWTHGWLPEDWSRAGFVSPLGIHIRIGETENHILMILTTTYLTNQLLYQRNPNPDYDNRRNGDDKRPSCTALILFLLQRMLQNDFSEYNAKNYQAETRMALLNLCSYAYDHEVRLAARMVLDYISAHIAVSSSDLRRMVPFRRRNEDPYSKRLPGGAVMDVGLLDWTLGADPMVEFFAMQTGHLRAFAKPNHTLNRDGFETRPWEWAIASNGNEAVIEALSDYRLPPSIHDLFINDHSRRFFQRLHRRSEGEESDHNADNMEIYAGSPSYLITAGGAPGPWAIDPGPALVQIASYNQIQSQLGAAVTTSFMPTGPAAGMGTHDNARDLIQLSSFSDGFYIEVFGEVRRNNPPAANYGVAPDFACGHRIHLPASWFNDLPSAPPIERSGKFLFVNRGSSANGKADGPGYYLAIFRDDEFAQNDVFACLEAFDTWLHPEVTFEQFKIRVRANNRGLSLRPNVETRYTTLNGNRLRFVIWNKGERDNFVYGAKVLGIEYGGGDPADAFGDAGNITDRFLNGTIMNSTGTAVIEITNPALGTKITLDMSDPWRPRRIAETGEVEQAGPGSEVWVDFDWGGPSEGDFYRPFRNLTDAVAAVAHGGVIKIAPGSTREIPVIPRNKRFRITAPAGGVRVGVR